MRQNTGKSFAIAALYGGSMLALSGCGTTEFPVILGNGLKGDGGTPPGKEPARCVAAIVYVVEGDLFTSDGGSINFVYEPAIGASGGSIGGGNGDGPGIGTSFSLEGYAGRAALLWGTAVVDSFTFDKAFVESGQTHVIGFDAPDGARYEYHVYGSAKHCTIAADPYTLTREEVAALES